ncbi:MAG: YhcH/YjgK/YiaL family protein [Pleomorphochaeta sp.]
MISTNIVAIEKDKFLSDKFSKAIDFIKNNDVEKLDAGVFEICGKELYAQVIDFTTEDRKNIKAESHIKYIDMQYVVNGDEKLGFKVNDGSYLNTEYIEERDLLYYDNNIKNESFAIANKGSINIFFPEDIHMPGIKVSEKKMIRKIVFKISLDYYFNK